MDKLCEKCDCISEGIDEDHKFCLNCGNQLYFTLEDYKKAEEKKKLASVNVAAGALVIGGILFAAVLQNIIPALIGVGIGAYLYVSNNH